MEHRGSGRVPLENRAEDTIFLKPFEMMQKSAPLKKARSFQSGYKIALLASDILVAMAGYFLGAWIAGQNFSLEQDPGRIFSLLILSLTTIAFFKTHSLYSYHFLVTREKHLKNLAKCFCWSIITLGLIYIVVFGIGPLETRFPVFLITLLLTTVAILFISRFLWSHVLDFLMAIGIALLVVGLSRVAFNEGPSAIMTNVPLIFTCFTLAVMILAASRIFIVHVIFNQWLRRYFRGQVVIVGSDEEANNIVNHVIQYNAPFWIVGTVGPKAESGLNTSVPKIRIGAIRQLPIIISQFKIDDIIITDEEMDKPKLISLLDFCTSTGINAWFPPKLMPIISIKIQIDNFCGLPMIRMCSQKNTWLFDKLKHGSDALLSLIFFILQLPFFLAISLAVKLESPGPVFYKAQAVGKNGKTYQMYKFRSMEEGSDSGIHKEFVTRLIKGEIGYNGDECQPLKITDDPRVTRLGKFLRKFSLDELPQLINVLKGDMSLVGPRPCLTYEYSNYQEWFKKRVAVRAGITGLWQVTGRSSVSFEDMILLDLYYIYNRDFNLDFNILFETIFVILGKKGAY
jgi:exopolysaccharide biosynthesis polyprenyl glycosylphosphotransferase